MKKSLAIICMVMTVVLMATGCGSNKAEEAKKDTDKITIETASEDEADAESVIEETHAPFATEIRVIVPDEDFLHTYEEYSEYEEDADGMQILFMTNSNITDFEYIAYEAEVKDNGELVVTDYEVLFEADSLGQEHPFLLTTMIDGAIPNRGIKYVDASGQIACQFVSISGEDGSPIIGEVTLK